MCHLTFCSLVFFMQLEIKNEELENECERLSLDVTIAQSEKTQTELSEVEELQFAHEKLVAHNNAVSCSLYNIIACTFKFLYQN